MAVRAHENYLPSDLTSYQAAGDLSAGQYHFVEMESDVEVDVCDNASDDPEGILTNKPSGVGKVAEVMNTVGKSVKLLCDGNSVNISVGSALGPNSSGHGVLKTSGKYYARALEAVASDGHIVPVEWIGPTDL